MTKERDELVGPTLGEELRTKALVALASPRRAAGLPRLPVPVDVAAAAVAAMAHDVLMVVGIFAWLGKPVDGVFLAAVLSIIGSRSTTRS